MIYVFEDKSDDLLSILFKKSFTEQELSHFIYTNGFGNFYSVVESILPTCNDEIVLFLDTILGNRHILDTYRDLKVLNKQNNNRLMVIPLVCSEYYFIKAIYENTPWLFKNKDGVELCVNKDFYLASPLLSDTTSKKFAKNFEKYCKLVLLNVSSLKDCVRHSRDNSVLNKRYSYFYSKNCVCRNKDEDCIDISLMNKSSNFLREYPCIPDCSNIQGKSLSSSEVISLHKNLIDAFNQWSDYYKSKDTVSNANKYKHFPYFV